MIWVSLKMHQNKNWNGKIFSPIGDTWNFKAENSIRSDLRIKGLSITYDNERIAA